MNTYKHSVYHDISKCTGCTTCLRHCPTEAIRIKNGRAIINEDRCIDCGECIRVCHSKAAKTVHTDLDRLNDFKWKIALPAPTLYGQFDNLDDVDYVLDGLLRVGFDDVFEVSAAAELVSAYTRLYLKDKRVKKPVISSACPVIVRLIGLRFPSLGEHIMHMLPPMEIAAHMARRAAKEKHPGAIVLVHPECTLAVTALADHALSTGGMLKFVRQSDAKEFVIGTECGIVHRMRKENPDKHFYPLEPAVLCPNMKKITEEDVLLALRNLSPRIELDDNMRKRALAPIDRMLEVIP